MNNAGQQQRGHRGHGGIFVPRFAGEAFAHEGNPSDGPLARRHTSQEVWKQPPSAALRAQVSR